MEIRSARDLRLIEAGVFTATQASADQRNENMSGLIVVLDVTDAGSASVTVKIQGKDQVSGKYYDILTGAAVSTTSTNVYKVHPSIAAVTNVSASDLIPHQWRVVVTHSDAEEITYTLGACLVW